ncbi:hypothetical protein RHSIM_Rhsim01G0121400 [Rhododendron simsii]|uniref:SHSP domain-containing protein n=1 Tax=Rhododendron simsii TaxID=118357 RepID=A0A834LW15_RHOSS|nr:hypothetical protein RHSIM_Rhsim01G0121400 [Rhododendron simsii]
MATGQQTGGITPSHPARAGRTVRPVYEDFTPTSEWKKQEQSQLLLAYLPGTAFCLLFCYCETQILAGFSHLRNNLLLLLSVDSILLGFAKEQINVSIEGKNTLRVRGESLVGDNKWSRFKEDFRIPEDCNISGVHAKFEGETLTVTLPNKTSPLAQVGPTKQEAKTPSREATSRPGDQVPPKTISAVSEAKKTEGKGITEGPSSPKVATEPPKSPKGQGETPPKPAPSTPLAKQPADGKGVESTSAAKIIPGTTETKERSEGKGNLAEVKTPENIATGQRTGGITPSHPARAGHAVRPAYEDFTPTSEWKKQEQSQLLLVYLPGTAFYLLFCYCETQIVNGFSHLRDNLLLLSVDSILLGFAKEQINVSVEGKNTLRVRGESLVGDNKWSRFQEDFHIPEDCNISRVRAKFEGDILTVTLPNKTSPLAQVGPTKQEATTPSREATSRPGDQVPPKTVSAVSEAKKTEGRITEGPSSPKVATESPKSQKGQGETPPKPAPSTPLAKQPADGKGVGSTTAAKIIPWTTETKERSEGKGNLAEVKTPENIALEKAVQKEKDIDEKGKESLMAENYIEKVVKKEKEESGGTATAWRAKTAGFSDVQKQKQTTNDVTSGGGGSYEGLAEKYRQMEELIAKRENLTEERQLLLNMGTAILVIVALGAYISYTIGGSSGTTEH